MSNNKLIDSIIRLSKADEWHEAIREWTLQDIYEVEEPEECLCGHYPIKEICVLRNKINSNIVDVGNVCVKKFLGLPSNLIFSSIKRVRENVTKSFSPITLDWLYDSGLINRWEYKFCKSTRKKRKLSYKQMSIRLGINTRLVFKFIPRKSTNY